MAKIQKITPFLWFDSQAEAATNFYISVFGNSKIDKVTRHNEQVLVVDFSLGGHKFHAMNAGSQFKFNPSISFFVVCETESETDSVWQQLSEGGMTMIPLAKQAWSEKYGFVQDRYGICWQISMGKIEEVGQKFTPSLLFTGPQKGRGEAAVRFYTDVFADSSITGIQHYAEGEEGPKGTVKHAQFQIAGQTFMIMDNPMDQAYTFNEAISFMVNCEGQEEVDYFWDKLTADGGEESMCGWLKDKFGVSWQIIPAELLRLMSDPDPAVAQRTMNAMLQMRKIEIAKLTQEPEGAKTAITVQNTVNVPIEKAWQFWTGPEHIMQWNNASDDWHTPKASNDLQKGGKFVFTMASRDGSFSFDFEGVYDEVIDNHRIAYTMSDGRKAEIIFQADGDNTHIVETFDAENMNSHEMQRAGWQAILDNFKKYAESHG